MVLVVVVMVMYGVIVVLCCVLWWCGNCVSGVCYWFGGVLMMVLQVYSWCVVVVMVVLYLTGWRGGSVTCVLVMRWYSHELPWRWYWLT